MNNEEKLDFIKANYKSLRCWELLQGNEKQEFYLEDYYKIDDLYINKSTFKTID